MKDCNICPRKCNIDRTIKSGACTCNDQLLVSRASLHHWEEPCISGANGSGTVFFSGCNLHCVYCQNYTISTAKIGKIITPARLADIFLELQDQKAHNINLVTPTHFIPQIAYAIELSKSNGLSIPIVYNTGSYENVESLRRLDGLIDIYLPDLKYFSTVLSSKYSHASDYFSVASSAIKEMVRQVGDCQFGDCFDYACDIDADLSETHLMKKGVIVRHLVLPNCTSDSKKILQYLKNTFHNHIYISIMSQFTPLPQIACYPELNRKLSKEEYDEIISYCIDLDLEQVFIQDGQVAEESFIPDFNNYGV